MEENIVFKAVELLHQNQYQLSCHQIWCKLTLKFLCIPQELANINATSIMNPANDNAKKACLVRILKRLAFALRVRV